jgi:hypothetical protein
LPRRVYRPVPSFLITAILSPFSPAIPPQQQAQNLVQPNERAIACALIVMSFDRIHFESRF